MSKTLDQSKKKKKKKKRFSPGDQIVLIVGSKRLPAIVLEDRGFIGADGRQLLRIRQTGVSDEFAEPFEVPAAEVEHAD
jgi:hypothetical protein